MIQNLIGGKPSIPRVLEIFINLIARATSSAVNCKKLSVCSWCNTLYNGKIGFVINTEYLYPDDPENEEHQVAKFRALQFKIELFAHPIFSKTGGYPKLVREIVDENSQLEGRLWSRLPTFDKNLTEFVRGSADFLGVNYYSSRIVKPANPDDFPNPSMSRDLSVITYTRDDWKSSPLPSLYMVPEGMYGILKYFKDNYGDMEILVTENGWGDHGEMEDYQRINYLTQHFAAILKAIKEGCNVIGHITWSIIDNFEWLDGYSVKFGLYHVDFTSKNLTRTPKKSAGFLRDLQADSDIPSQM